MRQVLAATACFVLLVVGLAWSQGAIPGGHEAFLYWWNGTAWTPAQSSQPIPVAPVAGSTIIVVPLILTPVAASTSVESNHVLKGSAGTLYGVQVNTTTSAEWVMLFNLTALPSNGAVTPIAFWQVPANSTLSISEDPAFTMSVGITIGCSTTGPFTLTASALCTFAGGQVQ